MREYVKQQQGKLDLLERKILTVERLHGVVASQKLRKRWVQEFALLERMRA